MRDKELFSSSRAPSEINSLLHVHKAKGPIPELRLILEQRLQNIMLSEFLIMRVFLAHLKGVVYFSSNIVIFFHKRLTVLLSHMRHVFSEQDTEQGTTKKNPACSLRNFCSHTSRLV